MAFDILRDGNDYTDLKCVNCGEVIISQFRPFYVVLEISTDHLSQIQKHEIDCPKKPVT